jgi:hypothetical protein
MHRAQLGARPERAGPDRVNAAGPVIGRRRVSAFEGHTTNTGNPPYSNLPYLQRGTAFDPSGVHVNSAESDSAVRCEHGEFESSTWAGEFFAGPSWHRLIAASASATTGHGRVPPGWPTVSAFSRADQ